MKRITWLILFAILPLCCASAQVQTRYTSQLVDYAANNFTALRTIPRDGTGSPVMVKGRTQVNDGGGGVFYWNSSSVSADNGGTVLAVAGVTTGRWIRQVNNAPYDVRWFGATGNGVSDDTTSIRAAVSALPTAGSRLYFPAGTYRVSAYTLFQSYSDLTIEGDGSGSILQPTTANAAQFGMLEFDSCHRVTIRNLQLDGRWTGNQGTVNANTSMVGVYYAAGSDNLTVTNCFVQNMPGDGIKDMSQQVLGGHGSTGGSDITDVTVKKTLLDNDRFYNCKRPIFEIDGARKVTITNCHFDDCKGGIKADGQRNNGQTFSTMSGSLVIANCQFRHVTNCTGDTARTAGITAEESEFDVRVADCMFEDFSGADGVFFDSGQGGESTRDLDLAGCHFVNFQSGYPVNIFSEQDTTSEMRGVRITGCSFRENEGTCINVAAQYTNTLIRGLTITHNQFYNTGTTGDGLSLTGGTWSQPTILIFAQTGGTITSTTIEGNLFRRTDTPLFANPYALRVLNSTGDPGTITDVTVHGNEFYGEGDSTTLVTANAGSTFYFQGNLVINARVDVDGLTSYFTDNLLPGGTLRTLATSTACTVFAFGNDFARNGSATSAITNATGNSVWADGNRFDTGYTNQVNGGYRRQYHTTLRLGPNSNLGTGAITGAINFYSDPVNSALPRAYVRTVQDGHTDEDWQILHFGTHPSTTTSDPVVEPLILSDKAEMPLGASITTTLMLNSLPTADPHNLGQVWSNAGTLKVSGG